MGVQDAEIEFLRNEVSCAAVLEGMAHGWRLDRRESTRRALKYRSGIGEILIVSHDGRGWWDPQSTAKGDVFGLVQYLEPCLNFGQVRQVLRRLVGRVPPIVGAVPEHNAPTAHQSLRERWLRRPRLRPGSPAWRYLAEVRCLPEAVLRMAATADAVREGHHGSAWFAHWSHGAVSHVEVRGPDFRGALRGGTKTLFRFGRAGEGLCRVAIAEAPIDALSLAAIEAVRTDTLYLATGGGMGPGTMAAIETLLEAIRARPGAVLASAADADAAGERYAARHAAMAEAAGVRFERLLPTVGTDWNDTLQQHAGRTGKGAGRDQKE